MSEQYNEGIEIEELFYRGIGKTEEEMEEIAESGLDFFDAIYDKYGITANQYYHVAMESDYAPVV